MNFPILSYLILLPSIGAIFLFFTKSKQESNLTIKYVALFTSLVNFFLSIYLWVLFDQSTSAGISFPLTNVIQGWQEGIPLFSEGGTGKLLIPSADSPVFTVNGF